MMKRIILVIIGSFVSCSAWAQAATELPATATPDTVLAGINNGSMYLVSPDHQYQFFPHGRLQTDALFLQRGSEAAPFDTLTSRRARLEMAGRVGSWVGFHIAGDFSSAANGLPATDNYVLLDPWRNALMFQLGQFDAPFSLENRMADKYFDFMERSATVRAFGVPTNKEVGAMVSGLLLGDRLYYSLGAFNGDGRNVNNVDNHFDLIGRAFVAPWAEEEDSPLHAVSLGASLWTGVRGDDIAKSQLFVAQTTQMGFGFFGNKWSETPAGKTKQNMELRQQGSLTQWALELNAPIHHLYGLRAEYIHKSQNLAEIDVTAAAKAGQALLQGSSAYVQVWYWLVGDDTIVPFDTAQRLPKWRPRPSVSTATGPRTGLMIALRYEHLDETLSNDGLTVNPGLGRTRMDSGELGINYWYSKTFRATINALVHHFAGDSAAVQSAIGGVNGASAWEQELGLRLAIAL